MRNPNDMSGVERAAALLVALGPKVSAEILKELDEPSIEKLSVEMARINTLGPEEKEELLGQFLIDLKRERMTARGGPEQARETLEMAFGSKKADEILAKLDEKDYREEFTYLNEMDDGVLSQFLSGEHPQTIAVVLGHLDPAKSATILKTLGGELATAVVGRMARIDRVVPEAVVKIAKTVREKYETQFRGGFGLTPGGMKTLTDIIGHLDGSDEKKIMEELERSMPDVAQQIRDTVFSFENVVFLTNTEVRVLIDEIHDDRLIATALKGAGDDIRFKFLRNMSRNRATDVITEMKNMGPVLLTEVEDCRKSIVSTMRHLHDNGVITVKTERDVLID